MSQLDRLRRVSNRVRTGRDKYVYPTTRPAERTMVSRGVRREESALASLFLKWVKPAASRNAQQVASLPLRVYRQAPVGAQALWRVKTLDPTKRGRVLKQAGVLATKRIGASDDIEEITDERHPVCALFNAVNDRDNAFDFLETTELYLGLFGDAFWYIVLGAMGWPVEMFQMHPAWTRVVPEEDGSLAGFTYGRDPTRVQAFLPEEVIQHRRPNPTGDPWRGFGDLQACAREAELSAGFTSHALAMLANQVQPGLIIQASRLTSTNAEQLRSEIRQRNSGIGHAGDSLVITGEDIDVKPWTVGKDEASFLQSDTQMREVIANCFDMPVSMLTLDNAALATAAAGPKQWRMMAIVPRAQRIEDKINERLMPMFREPLNDPTLFVAFDPPVDEDDASLSTRILSEVAGNVRTINEARSELGLEALPDGDVLVMDREAALNPAPVSPFTFSVGGGHAPNALGAEPLGGRSSLRLPGVPDVVEQGRCDVPAMPAEDRGARSVRVDGEGIRLGGGVDTGADLRTGEGTPQSSIWLRAHTCCDRPPRLKGPDAGPGSRVIRATERELSRLLRRWFRGLMPTLLDAINPETGVLSELVFDDAAVRESFAAEDGPGAAFGEMFAQGWGVGARELSGRVALDLIIPADPRALAFLEESAQRLLGNYTATVEHGIRGALSEAIEAGEGLRGRRDAIQGAIEGLTDRQAEVIAQTEGTRAMMVGRVDAWVATGAVRGKEWKLSGNPCEICRTIAANFNRDVGLGSSFVPQGTTLRGVDGGVFEMDYEDVNHPPAHPNCRCTLVAVFDD